MSETAEETPVEPEAAPAEAPIDPVPTPGMGVSVYQGLPDVTMIVNAGNHISPSGEDHTYYEGETIRVDGPTAIALAAAGHASVVGDMPSENGASAETPAEGAPAEEAPVEEAPAE